MTTISPATCYLQQQRTSGNLHLIDHQVLRWWQHSLSTVFPARTMTMVQHPNLPQHHQWCHARPRPLQPLVTCNDEDHQVSSTSLIAKYWDYGNAHHAQCFQRERWWQVASQLPQCCWWWCYAWQQPLQPLVTYDNEGHQVSSTLHQQSYNWSNSFDVSDCQVQVYSNEVQVVQMKGEFRNLGRG